LSAQAPMRIAAGEEGCDIKEMQQLMDVGGIDVVQVDVARVGGLARAKRVGWDAAERHKLCVNHSYKTGVNIAASLHFVAALPNTHYFEYCVEQGALRQQLTKQRFPVVDGTIRVPEEAGLGGRRERGGGGRAGGGGGGGRGARRRPAGPTRARKYGRANAAPLAGLTPACRGASAKTSRCARTAAPSRPARGPCASAPTAAAARSPCRPG